MNKFSTYDEMIAPKKKKSFFSIPFLISLGLVGKTSYDSVETFRNYSLSKQSPSEKLTSIWKKYGEEALSLLQTPTIQKTHGTFSLSSAKQINLEEKFSQFRFFYWDGKIVDDRFKFRFNIVDYVELVEVILPFESPSGNGFVCVQAYSKNGDWEKKGYSFKSASGETELTFSPAHDNRGIPF